VIRIARIAMVGAQHLIGAIGAISPDLLTRIRRKLADWLNGTGTRLPR